MRFNVFLAPMFLCFTIFALGNANLIQYASISLGETYCGDSIADTGEHHRFRDQGPFLPFDLEDDRYYDPPATKYFENVSFPDDGTALWVGLLGSQIVVEERLQIEEIGLAGGKTWGGTMSIPTITMRSPGYVHFALYTDKGGKPDKLVHVLGMVLNHPDNLSTDTFGPAIWSSNPMWFRGELTYDFELEAGVYWLVWWYNTVDTYMVNSSADVNSYAFYPGDPNYEYTDVEGYGFPHTAKSRFSTISGSINKAPVPYRFGRMMAFIRGEYVKDVSEYASELFIEGVPEIIYVGEEFNFNVSLSNVGSIGWSPSDFFLGVTPGSTISDEDVWGKTRVALPVIGEINYGDAISFNHVLSAPVDEGNYTLTLQMVHDWSGWGESTWFGDVVMKTVNVVPVPNSWVEWSEAPSHEWFRFTLDDYTVSMDAEVPNCYRISDFGVVEYLGDNVYVLNVALEKWTGECSGNVEEIHYNYVLDSVPEGHITLLLYNNGILSATAVLSQASAIVTTPPVVNGTQPWNPVIVEPTAFSLPVSWWLYLGIFFGVLTTLTWNTRLTREIGERGRGRPKKVFKF